MTLASEDLQTPGFALASGTNPVGITLDRDGSSVWILGTGSNQVLHVRPNGSARAYQLPASELGINLSQSQDGTTLGLLAAPDGQSGSPTSAEIASCE